MTEVIWHDLECGHYTADLPLWRALATTAGGPVLDVGAGSGRVTLDLLRHGHSVTALDVDAELLEALAKRAEAAGRPVATVCAQAQDFAIPGARFALVIVPMQTVQLLGGTAGRVAFLRNARDHLAPGGLLALAIADARDAIDPDHSEPPPADTCERDGVRYATTPVDVRDEGATVVIERVRSIRDADGMTTNTTNLVALDHLDAERLMLEGEAVGLTAQATTEVPPTDDYIGSTVVMLRG